jgi:predicted nucleic acid-binding protein
VGVLAGKSGHDDVADVAVAESAIRRGNAVVTADAEHIRMVAAAAGMDLWIEPV